MPLVQAMMKERGLSFREAVNSGLRAGLTRGKKRQSAFVQTSVSLGSEQSFRWDKALEAAALIEDEELTRKLALRK